MRHFLGMHKLNCEDKERENNNYLKSDKELFEKAPKQDFIAHIISYQINKSD